MHLFGDTIVGHGDDSDVALRPVITMDASRPPSGQHVVDDSLLTSAVTTGAPIVPAAPIAFAPGAILAGRYRLVALLGRGGMGEVYRADDLILDQPVALKFLPSGVQDEGRLGPLHQELRVARQISHKNVCRLYDLGEAAGRRFLTMEYIDGEDLASLIRRIGRLPHDKAVQIARQLCAAIAAAHERGVIHRDLKPANVMIDGQGDVRVTDFGIATAKSDNAEFVGTPQYMAPEQFAGGAASIKSDIYALGLTIFEVFTGRRAQDSKTLEELRRFHQTGTHTTPSSIVRDLDPGVERVILRCLERDPDRRPASALVVAAALPGGDPLAAALAAGETPSPEALAAAGESEALGVGYGLSLVVAVIAGLLVFTAVSQRTSLIGRTPLADPPDVLVNRAENLVASLGYTDSPGDTASGFIAFADYTQWLRSQRPGPDRWDVLSSGNPSAVLFWYRSSPRQLIPVEDASVALADPPSSETGMREVVLDPRGRLQRFRSVPPQFDEDASIGAAAPWVTLFEAAGLSMSTFVEAQPQWAPPDFADTRAAWTGPHPTLEDVMLRVEGAAYRGKPVFFDVIGPWTEPERMETDQESLGDQILLTVLFTTFSMLIAAAAVLARRHIRDNRADRRGAWRVTAYLAIASTMAWLLRASHSPSFDEVGLLFRAAGDFALLGVIFWTVYVALEPYVRKLRPDALLGWSRLLAGHVRDPRVGRDLLIGVIFGVTLALMDVAKATISPALGFAAPYPRYGVSETMLSGGSAAFWAALLESLSAVGGALFATFGIVIARLVLRVRWLALVVTILFLSLFATADMAEALPLSLVFSLASGMLLTIVAIRFGLLSLVVAWFAWGLIGAVPMTLEFSHWRADASNWTLALLIALTLFGFYASRAGQPLFGSILGEDR
jgi:serine/threonine-protein kinase